MQRSPELTAIGLGLGALTPLLVLVLNGVWGLATAWWLESFIATKTAADGRFV